MATRDLEIKISGDATLMALRRHKRTTAAVAREMLNLRGPAQERTVHEWARRLLGTGEES